MYDRPNDMNSALHKVLFATFAINILDEVGSVFVMKCFFGTVFPNLKREGYKCNTSSHIEEK